MKKRYIKATIMAMILSLSGGMKAQQINPMTEAVIRGYNEILADNPKDYYTLYDRASQYYSIGNLDRALSDIDMALEYTPASEKDYRVSELGLKAEILMAKKEYRKSLEATNEALKINPSSQTDLYRLGNLFLIENNGEGALKAFSQLQRENSRSQEAFYGMAKANVMLNRIDDAQQLINQIESLGKNSFITFCRIGDLYIDMNKTKEASSNYIKAFIMDNGSNRPIESLKFLAKRDYPAVIDAIDTYQTASPDNISFPYLKAVVAFDAGDYNLASQACQQLEGLVKEPNPSVYRMMAISQKAMGNITDAVKQIDKAQEISPNNADILADKADILLAIDATKALASAQEALGIDTDNEFALLTGAKAAILAADKDKGLEYLNDIILINPANVEALLLRGYLYDVLAKDGKLSVQDYGRAGNIKSDNAAEKALIALGKAKAGKKLDAEGIIKEAIEGSIRDKEALYNIAVYYSQTGSLDKAKEYVDKAVKAGYTNQYNLKANNEPLLNLTPIYHLMK